MGRGGGRHRARRFPLWKDQAKRDRILATPPAIPVLVIYDARHARPVAETLVCGGVRTVEVTLRTPQAFDAIREM